MSDIPARRCVIVALTAVFILLASPCQSSPTRAQAPAVQAAEQGLADTPWPMYQHDPQHTGRSPLLGPTNPPELLWTVQLPDCIGENGGISITQDGNLLLSIGGCLRNFDPVTREIRWTYAHSYNSRSVPLVDNAGNIYWGHGMEFGSISSEGETNWLAALDPNWVFGSSPTFGVDGNLYFIHDSLWSFTPSGEFRWYIPYGYLPTHASPAIGSDGAIYAGGNMDLCAYRPDTSLVWCEDIPGDALDMNPAVGSDGMIYMPSKGQASGEPPYDDAGVMYAISSAGALQWFFDPEEENYYGIPDGMAIAPDGSIYFGLNTGNGIEQNYLYAIDAGGQFRWRAALPDYQLSTTPPFIRYPITTDRAGNVYLCTDNSRCYGFGPDGSALWETGFPVVDSLVVYAGSQPIIAADGLIYLVDNQDRLYAYADPYLVPALKTPVSRITYDLDPGAPAFTATLPITSTVAPITYTAAITPAVNWMSIAEPVSSTPSGLLLQFDPGSLPAGSYHTRLQVKPASQAGAWLVIPVTLNLGLQQVYLPVTQNDHLPSRILYASYWFEDSQIASIDSTGQDRQAIAHHLPFQVDDFVFSPDGKKVITWPLIDGKHQFTVLDTGTGEVLLNILDPVFCYDPAWSPDSQRIVFASQRDNLDGELYVINLDGSGLTRLTYNDQLREATPRWSPAGDKIAYQASPGIYLMNPDGSDVQQILPYKRGRFLIGWSPDGKALSIWGRDSYDEPTYLGVYDLQTEVLRILTDNYNSGGVWSPDGTRIAFTGWTDGKTGLDIYAVQADGSGAINLTEGMGNFQDESQPAWSPDSRWLVFTVDKEEPIGMDNYDLYVIRPDGTGLRQVTTNLKRDYFPFWQP